jgi:hypothetical protein
MEKKQPRFESTSGLKGIDFLATELRAQQWSIRQYAQLHEETEYDRGRLVIGIDEDGGPFTFNLRKSAKIIAIAPTGSGKSVLEQSYASRFFAAGGKVAIPNDIKGVEYALCNKPLQKELWQYLLKYPIARPVDEKPIGMPVKAYYPYFFSKFVSRSFPNQQYCQFRLEDLNIYDFLTIADIYDLSPLQKAALEEVFTKIREGGITDLVAMENYMLKNRDIGKATAKLLVATAKQLEAQEVIGNQFPMPDFANDIVNGKVPVLNTYGSLNAGKGINNYISAYVAVLLRHLYNAKASGKIPRREHLMLILDEINRLCPNIGNPSSKVALLDMLRLSRSEKISMFFSCQYLTDVPDILVDQATHIMIPGRRMNTETIRSIMQQFAPWENDNAQVMSQSIALRQSQMKQFSWFCLDKRHNQTIIFKPAMPLCYHRSE